eukprot:3670789-Pyramimonas_sp.AAC.1
MRTRRWGRRALLRAVILMLWRKMYQESFRERCDIASRSSRRLPVYRLLWGMHIMRMYTRMVRYASVWTTCLCHRIGWATVFSAQ